jgi:ribonuclease G
MQDILINWAPQETRVAIIEHGAVQELHIERTLERGRVGNIYKGRVVRVLPGMQSAFVDVGLGRTAFLHVADVFVPGAPRRSDDATAANPVNPGLAAMLHPPIEKLMVEGQTLTVQVIKDALGSKGARLSTQISIAGRLLVFLPHDTHIGVSQKISSPELREQLKARVSALATALTGEEVPGVESSAAIGGFILRTNAEESTDAELLEDIVYLRKTWAAVQARSQTATPGTLLHQDLGLSHRVLRDLVHEATQAIYVDAETRFSELRQFGEQFTPSAVSKLQLYTGEKPIFELYHVDAEINRALQRRVDLPSGGYLVIDQTEALTTIDVNTGGFVGTKHFDETIFKTNVEAAQALARQLRLRNLGGIIIVDFIDMTREDHQAAVLQELQLFLARDHTKTTIGTFTQLGLIEITRKRTRESLAHVLCQPCAQCSGTGQVKTPRTVCYEIMREIARESGHINKPNGFRVLAASSVIDLLMGEEKPHLMEINDLALSVALHIEPGWDWRQYEIVLI